MKFIRMLIILTLLSGSAAIPVQANPEGPALQGQTLYFPIVFNTRDNWIGPSGGSVIGLEVHPTNPDIVYAGTFGAGVYKTTNGGASWAAVNTGLPNLRIQSLALDPQQPDTLFAGTYRDETLAGNEGIYITTNGGQTWVKSSTGLQASVIVYSIAIDPTDSNRLYIATRGQSNNGSNPWNGKVYRSINGGASWINVPSMESIGGSQNQDWIYSIRIHPQHPNQVFAAAHEFGPFYSTDYGQTWSSSTSGIETNDLNGRSIAVDPDSGQTATVYFGVWKRAPGVYRSVNGGQNWVAVRSGLNGSTVYGLTLNPHNSAQLFTATFSNGVYVTSDYGDHWAQSGLPLNKTWIVAPAASNPSVYYTGTFGDGVFKSGDGGATWARAAAGIGNSWITSVVSVPGSPAVLFASLNGGGVFRSTNGGQTWQDYSANLPDKYINALAVNPAGTILFALSDTHGLFRSPISTGGWTTTAGNLPHTLDTDPLYPQDHPLADWESLEMSLSAPSQEGDGLVLVPAPSTVPLVSLKTAPSNPQVMYLGTDGSGLYRSPDGGANWASAGLAGEKIWGVAIHPANADIVYASTSAAGDVRISTNGGASWSPLSISGRSVFSLLMPPSASPVLYAGTDSGVYVFNGTSWESRGLSGMSISTLSADPANPALIVAGTTAGARITVDGGANWSGGPDDLAGLTIQSIEIIPGTRQVLYGTTYRGIYQGSLP